jgi:small redox-active disulfide protein 2
MNMKIEVLGSGCAKCTTLYENTQKTLVNLGLEAEVVKVTDMQKIIQYGVMVTPALVVDGVVKSAGKVLNSDEISKLLMQ